LTENRLFATLWIVNHLDAQTELKKRIECLRTTHIKKNRITIRLAIKRKDLRKDLCRSPAPGRVIEACEIGSLK